MSARLSPVQMDKFKIQLPASVNAQPGQPYAAQPAAPLASHAPTSAAEVAVQAYRVVPLLAAQTAKCAVLIPVIPQQG